MISFTTGNLLEANVEAVVNTVNTVGIMGKGIALMFKEQFPENFEAYSKACARGEVQTGNMFVTGNASFFGPKWIVNFPTKKHWRTKTKVEWIEDGLADLVRVIREREIKSIAIPPLGCGNGGLDWSEVKPLMIDALAVLDEDVQTIIYEPTSKYQNVAKRNGVEKLTPARALVAEMVRRYCLLGIDCSILEVQKLGWFLERAVKRYDINDPLKFDFSAQKYGPYSHNLQHLLNSLDGSYLRCDKRLADAEPLDLIWFNEDKRERVSAYLNSGEGKTYAAVLDWASFTVDGFESPLGMELLATVDWLIERDDADPTAESVREGLENWAGGKLAGERKLRIFDERLIKIALGQLKVANTARQII